MPSVWFLIALVAIVVPAAPALFRLEPLWRNYLVPFTGPGWEEYPTVLKRFLLWGAGAWVSGMPIALILMLVLGSPNSPTE